MAVNTPDSPRLSVDVVPISVDPGGHLRITLVRRLYAPHKGEWALPGVLVLAGESLAQACSRALESKVGVTDWARMERTGIYDSPVRDSRGHTITVAHLAVVSPVNSPEVMTVPLADLPEKLPFDHTTIIVDVLTHLAAQLWDDEGVRVRALLGNTFTTSAFAAILTDLDPTFNTTNTHRLLRTNPLLETVGGGASTGGRAPKMWAFRTTNRP